MDQLTPNGVFADIQGHKIHVFRTGDANKPKLVFLSGSGTAAPSYDFKILYSKLSDRYRIIVIEKFGYGYSDLFEGPTDIDQVVDYQREALKQIGEDGPYILLPHSMSGLEAMRWIQLYPDEVTALIGIDMATPKTYLAWEGGELDKRIASIKKMQKLKKTGLLDLVPRNKRGLTKEEIKQQTLLWKRNGMNGCILNEAYAVIDNAKTVENGGKITCPVLLFVSNGKPVSAGWIEDEKKFAEQTNAEMVCCDCGHYMHYFESGKMSEKISSFLSAEINACHLPYPYSE